MLKLSPHGFLKERLTAEFLDKIFEEKVSKKRNAGIDGLTPEKFSTNKKFQYDVIIRKLLKKTYNFSPYYELLKSKGREELPRAISLPVVRDRLGLLLLKEVRLE